MTADTIDSRQQLLESSVREIRKMRARLESIEKKSTEPIAVIGMSCRMPGDVNGPDEYWQFLRRGGDGISDIPSGRWDVDRYYDPSPDTPGTMYTRRGGFLSDVSGFDAPFFGISPREADLLDPQQRLLLEVAWEALEHAGQRPGAPAGTDTGVFVGVTTADYQQMQMRQMDPADFDAYLVTSSASPFAAGRLSYWLGASGPSLSVDTACSSSLVSVHLACQSLRAGDCSMALAGGVNLLLAPEPFVMLSRAKMLSPDGTCKTFDASADGYARGEGCGVVVLKRLSDAVAHGDRVLALIRGSAVNQDGRSGGITVPNGAAQQALIRQALESASLSPSDISYVEAHGTGTRLGDPIEIRALAGALGQRPDGDRLLVGSVKTNIGHLEAAAGVAGLIKVVLALRHGEIPPHLRLTAVNPEMSLDELGIDIPTRLMPWPEGPGPRVAGVSSFGASGTNACVLLQEAPAGDTAGDREESLTERSAHVLTLSARTEGALRALAGRYARRLADAEPEDLPDICYSANTGRARFAYRAAVEGPASADLSRQLAGFADGAEPSDVQTGHVRPGHRPKVAFLFTGQGAQYPGMAQELYESEPLFRQALDLMDEAVTPVLGRSLLSILYPGPGDESLIYETCYAQPALVAVEYALATLWRSWGVEPDAVLGHSVGGLGGACVAAVMDPADGIRLAAHRGRLMQELCPPGTMAAVFGPVEEVRKAVSPLPPDAAIATVNGPEHVVISGSETAVGELCARLAAAGMRTKPLKVRRAFHSPLIDAALDAFEAECARVAFAPPQMQFVSDITGRVIPDGTTLSATVLRDHARQPVQFDAGLNTLLDAGYDTFVEVGPAPSLITLAKGIVAARGVGDGPEPCFLPSLRRGHNDWQVLARSAGLADIHGCEVDWDRFDLGRRRQIVDLPTYPFQRTRHWFRPSASLPERPAAASSAVVPQHRAAGGSCRDSGPGALLGQRVPAPSLAASFESWLDQEEHPCLGDCVIDGLTVVNVGVYLEAAIAAAVQLGHRGPVTVEGLSILRGLVLEEEATRTHAVLESGDGRRPAAFRYYAEHPGDEGTQWLEHAKGQLQLSDEAGDLPTSRLLDEVRGRLSKEITGEEFYRQMWRRKIYLGPAAKWLELVWQGDGEAAARMRLPTPGETSAYLLHPGITDAMFQLLFACLPEGSPASAFMLVSIDRFTFYGVAPEVPLFCHATLTRSPDSSAMLIADVSLRDAAGRLVAEAVGAYLRRADRAILGKTVEPDARPASAPGSQPSRLLSLAEPSRPDGASAAAMPVNEIVLAAVAVALRAEPGALDLHEPLQGLGLDSLMALEVKETLAAQVGVSVPLTALLDGCSITSLTETVRSLLGQSAAGEPLPDGQPAASGEPERRGQAGPEPSEPGLVPDWQARNEPFPLTDLQQAYLVGRTDAFELGNVSTYFFVETDLDGIDVARLADSLRAMITRHDMLRSVVSPDGQQRVLAHVPPYEITTADLSGLDSDERDRRLAEIHHEMKNQVFDPAVWPLFDVRATRISDRTTRLHVGLDALVIDAWSTSILFREWAQAYRGETVPPEPGLTYRDYVIAARGLEGGEQHRRSAEYWQARIATLPPAPELPLAQSPSAIGRPMFKHRSGRVPADAWASLKHRSAAAGVTPSIAICTAYSQVIAAWSKSEDFTLNVLYFNRTPLHPDVKNVVGNFSATSLLEVRTVPGEPFIVRAQRMQRQLWADLEHSHVSGVRVLRDLNRARGSVSASMPVVFASTVPFGAREDSPAAGLAQHLLGMGDSGREVSASIRTPQVWLDHQVIEEHGELVVNWDVVEELFPAGMIDAMFDSYLTLLTGLCRDDGEWQRPTGVLVPEADLAMRRAVNSTAAPLTGGLLHDAFMARAKAEPDRPAVITPERTLTYGEIDALSGKIAGFLRSRGAAPGDLVGLVMEKGWEQIAGAIGVLKTGAAYVPVDAAVPPARLRMLLENSRISLVVTQSWVESRTEWPLDVERLSVDGEAVRDLSSDSFPCPAMPSDLAYVIYTSGSTGTPKGVMIEHGAALNTVLDVNDTFGVTPEDRVLGLSAFNFDLSVYDVFGLLSAGGAVVLPGPDALREPARWAQLAAEHRVTIWNSVPALMEMLADHLRGDVICGQLVVRVVMMSGDWIPVTLPDRIRDVLPDARLCSLGGATEASIWSISYPITDVDPAWSSIPYGKPMRNQQMHVLNAALQPCPTWVPGQLYIGGAGVARGYFNDEAKTKASFIRHPVTGERLYRTGDLGRYLPDGNIEFLGREDFQVKINGYRVELGEVEAALLRCGGVRAAAVIASGERQGPKNLVAYVVAEPGTATGPGTISKTLRSELPAYLVPQHVVMLDQLPMTANGKLDKSALPAIGDAAKHSDQAPPADQAEADLVALWEEFFAARPIGVNTSFFDLGGDSLLAVRLMSRIRQTTGRSLPLSTLFRHPTIRLLAEAVRESGGAERRAALVEVRAGEAVPPVLLVHPVGGDVLCYAELAAGFQGTGPVFGLQVPDVDPPLTSVPELAAHYITEASALPGAFHNLGGWSMGGVVALEMAQQLSRTGAEVGTLCLVDLLEPPGTELTDAGAAREISDAELVAWLARDLAGLSGRPWTLPEDRLGNSGDRSLLEVLHAEALAAGVLPAEVDIQALTEIFGRFASNARALADYRPEPYGGRVRFYRAADGGSSAQTVRQWMELFTGDAEVIDVPGDHYSIMRSPNVRVLAGHLTEVLTPATR